MYLNKQTNSTNLTVDLGEIYLCPFAWKLLANFPQNKPISFKIHILMKPDH